VGPKIYFLKLFFFIPGPFQGGHFLGGIIYFSALEAGPYFTSKTKIEITITKEF
jgi:hypothetical protein